MRYTFCDLPLHVLAAHVDDALEAVAGADRRRRDAVLPRAGLGNHARLAHATREHRLADRVVDLVRAGVVEVLAFQVDLRAAEFAAEPRGVVDGARPAHVVREFGPELGRERRIGLRLRVGLLEFIERVDQGLGDEGAAIGTEMPPCIGLLVVRHGDGEILQAAEAAMRASASRTASQNRRIAWASLTPFADSTPELTSTAQGRTCRMPSVTLAACNPPDKTTGEGTFAGISDQSKTFPPPP